MADILVVDDEASARSTLALLLRKRGHRVAEATASPRPSRPSPTTPSISSSPISACPTATGLDVLRAVKAQSPDADVILLTAYAGWESAKEAMQLGAFDYFEKGREPAELFLRIDRALADKALRRENENLRAQISDRYALPGIVARSPEMRRVLDLVAARGAHRRHRADPRRVGHRQGADRQGHPPREPPGARSRSSPSTAGPCPSRSSSPSCSAT